MTLVRLAFKRLASQPFLTALYIISLILGVGLMAAPSLFADSVSQAIMRDVLAERSNQTYRPTFAVRFYAIPKYAKPMGLAASEDTRAWLSYFLSSEMGIRVRTTYVQNESSPYKLRAPSGDTRYTEADLTDTKVVVVPHIGEHLETAAGAAFGESTGDEVLAVWVLADFAERLGLRIGERFQLGTLIQSASQIDVEIAGFVQPINPTEEFWYQRPGSLLGNVLLTTEQQYNTFVAPVQPEGLGYVFWYFVFDDARLNMTHAARYIRALERARYIVEQRLPNGRMDVAPLEELAAARERKRDLSLVLTALALPMMVVLAQFLGVVAGTFARAGARGDATIVSRGASRFQLLMLTLYEAIMCLLVSLLPGLLAGLGVARLLGHANGFLSFTAREAAPVFLAALDWQPVAIAALLGLIIRLWMTIRHSRLSIITYSRNEAGRGAMMTGFRLLIIALLVGMTAYTYRQLSVVGGVPLLETDDRITTTDPLLLLAPSLFLVTAPLILSELVSIIVGLLTRVVDPFIPASALVALRGIARERSRSQTPIFVMVISLALGVFYASLAYSSQIWLRDRMRHTVGADLTFDHAVAQGDSGGMQPSGEGAWLLPAQTYEQIPGVERATRVASYSVSARAGGRERPVRLIGVERLSFPQVAYYRPDYADLPMGELMNTLARNQRGALVPEALTQEYGLKLGDQLSLEMSYAKNIYHLNYEIAGFIRYFPTVKDGELAAIVNIESIFESIGTVMPHSIWMRLDPDTSVDTLLTAILRSGVVPGRLDVLAELARDESSRREFIGYLGMMSVSFLASLLVAALGSLVHLFAGLGYRKGEFALLRGIGFQLRAVIGSVLLEYLFNIAAGIALGAAVGITASRLYGRYLPLLAPIDNAIPPYIGYQDTFTTWAIVLAMAALALLMAGLVSRYLRRQRIFEVLRMG